MMDTIKSELPLATFFIPPEMIEEINRILQEKGINRTFGAFGLPENPDTQLVGWEIRDVWIDFDGATAIHVSWMDEIPYEG